MNELIGVCDCGLSYEILESRKRPGPHIKFPSFLAAAIPLHEMDSESVRVGEEPIRTAITSRCSLYPANCSAIQAARSLVTLRFA